MRQVVIAWGDDITGGRVVYVNARGEAVTMGGVLAID